MIRQSQRLRRVLRKYALDARLASEKVDMTLPADLGPQGSVHAVSQVMDELAEIFAATLILSAVATVSVRR